MSGTIAIVGRPNVGKSALFNRIVRRRIAVVHDEPGVTRDRIAAEAEWRGRTFTLVDTGGIGLLRKEKSADVIVKAAGDQVQLAIESADVIVFVVNLQEGIVPLDREVAQRLRACNKPVLIAVNKADNARVETGAVEFSELGFERMVSVSAIHGRGIDDLVKTAVGLLPPVVESISAVAEEGAEPSGSATGPALKLAIVGRPNVGKSSIINSLTRSERVIVSDIPGTTRDAVDVPFEVVTEGVRQQYVLIDTAGVRKKRSIDNSIEFFSVQRTEDSVARADMVVFVLDAESGIIEQDKKIADLITRERRPCIVVVNKWDLMADVVEKARIEEIDRRNSKTQRHAPKRMTTLIEFGEWVQEKLFFLDYAPVIFTSAKSGFNLDRLLEAVRYVTSQLQQKIPTALLNRTLHDAVERRQPVSNAGHRLKFFYATQTHQAPPGFRLYLNRDDLFSDQYIKYLQDELRKAFGFEGCPIGIYALARPKTIEPVRRHKKLAPKDAPKRSSMSRGKPANTPRTRRSR